MRTPNKGQPKDTQSKRTVLVVDNEKSVLEYVCSQLNQFGYSTITASTGKETIKLLNGQLNAKELIVVLDVALDEENGIEIAKEAISLFPTLRVLLISGFADDIVLSGYIPEGSRTAFLRKIFSASELVDAIRRLETAD